MSRLCAPRLMPARSWIMRHTRRKSRSSKTNVRSSTVCAWLSRTGSATVGLPVRQRLDRSGRLQPYPEPVLEHRLRERLRIQEALDLLAAEFTQQRRLARGLHALGDHLHVEVPRDQRDRADDGLVATAADQVAHEG